MSAAGFFSPAASLFFSDLGSFLTSPSLAAVAVAPSAPSVEASPSVPSVASASAGFSGSLIIVGAATVAITKSLSEIVGLAFSGSFTDEILILVPMSEPAKSIIISSGILSAEHLISTFRLTIFKTPPFLNPETPIDF